mmetsp:Transcript_55621/g.90082  ORF Transcript_55621/g.90082 Transcript_55621/m.90082 type:complete len:234 (-) Transcript_55621:370-1071(-)
MVGISRIAFLFLKHGSSPKAFIFLQTITVFPCLPYSLKMSHPGSCPRDGLTPRTGLASRNLNIVLRRHCLHRQKLEFSCLFCLSRLRLQKGRPTIRSRVVIIRIASPSTPICRILRYTLRAMTWSISNRIPLFMSSSNPFLSGRRLVWSRSHSFFWSISNRSPLMISSSSLLLRLGISNRGVCMCSSARVVRIGRISRIRSRALLMPNPFGRFLSTSNRNRGLLINGRVTSVR